MQFLNPLALYGLAAAILPIAIHLLQRGRPRDVPFSNLAFLRELHHSRMRDVRLRQWLVLLLRTLAVICLVLAFCRPALHAGGDFLAGTRPTTAVLLFDHSYSTRYAPPAGRLFDRLRRQAGQVLALLDEDRDQVYLQPFAERPGATEGPLSPAAARQRLEDHLPGDAGTDVGAAVTAAADLLAAHADRQGEIYLFTDLAAGGWQGVEAAPEDVPVYVVVADSTTPGNTYAGPVRIAAWLAAPGQPVVVDAAAGQYGGTDAEVAVDLFVDGERVQRRRARLAVDAETPVRFQVAPRRSGLLWGHVDVEDDALPVDNRRYFTLHVPDRVHVVLAGAAPQDLYYARRALRAAADGDGALAVTAVDLADLPGADLDDVEVLVLCNVEAPSVAQTRAVRRFAADGGGVLVLPGADADVSRLNRELLVDLVPAAIGDLVGRPDGAHAAHLDTAGLDAALFAGLLDAGDDVPGFRAHYDLVPQRQLAVLARFDDGRPALVEGHGPAGRALLWATPLDLSWSDLPLRGLFVPLLHRLCRYLAQPLTNAAGYTVGEQAWRRLPGLGLDTRVEVETPGGRRRILQPDTVLGDIRWRVPDLDAAGIWTVRAGDNERVLDAFAVNVDLREADLTRLAPAGAAARLGPGARILDGSRPLRDAVFDARFGRELWRELLALAGLLLVLEMWLARSPASTSRPQRQAA